MDNLLYPIMQIKANARIFKYNLLGDLAAIMLRFFDRVNVMDAFIVQIVGAFHSTSNHILSKKQKGDQGEIGEVLSKELDGACDRYLQNQKALFQRELKKVSTVSK